MADWKSPSDRWETGLQSFVESRYVISGALEGPHGGFARSNFARMPSHWLGSDIRDCRIIDSRNSDPGTLHEAFSVKGSKHVADKEALPKPESRSTR